MKKIKLTETDLTRIIQRVINEQKEKAKPVNEKERGHGEFPKGSYIR